MTTPSRKEKLGKRWPSREVQRFPQGGANGTRTRDPHTASVVRYQLRHSPLVDSSNVHAALMLPQISRHKA